MLRAVVLRRSGKAAEANYQREMTIALIESIVEGGDGGGFDSAWTVFREKEEYEVLKSKGYLVDRQSLVPHGARTFDVLRAHKPEGGEKIEAYFDITELFAREEALSAADAKARLAGAPARACFSPLFAASARCTSWRTLSGHSTGTGSPTQRTAVYSSQALRSRVGTSATNAKFRCRPLLPAGCSS